MRSIARGRCLAFSLSTPRAVLPALASRSTQLLLAGTRELPQLPSHPPYRGITEFRNELPASFTQDGIVPNLVPMPEPKPGFKKILIANRSVPPRSFNSRTTMGIY
jgi:hypothetical protein